MSIKNLFLWSPVIIFLGISGVALFGPYGLFGYNEARLKMINLAAADLTEIKVVVYKEPCEVKRLVSGDSSVCSFQIKADSHYRITWKELNAGIYREEVGYVTHGFDFKHELQILGNGKVNFKIDGSI